MQRFSFILILLTLSALSYASSIEVPEQYKLHVSESKYSVIEIEGIGISHVDCESTDCKVDSKRSSDIGKVVFKPNSSKEFVIFITDTSNSTYPVKIIPDSSVEANVYKIVPQQIVTPLTDEDILNIHRINKTLNTSTDRNNLALSLIKNMAEKRVPRNIQVQKVNQENYLWEEVKFIHLSNYRTGQIIGSSYEILNITKEELTLHELEFYTLKENVIAVAIEKPRLQSGQSTFIHLVAIEE